MMDCWFLFCLFVMLWVNGQFQIFIGDFVVMGFLGIVGIFGKFVFLIRYQYFKLNYYDSRYL